ncbi:N-acetylmuramoyl-L-alanine amidase family protein [Streptococcus mitis]|uniref:Choline binding protein A n=1 Tax=Streptococcus mitis TaxID=28037 RepID=A0A139QCT4_STRMT|nr:N-acetylmuramoyl-L-alanine amidase family protein [Streptococcus mitis]KXU00348.1 Choline binding protein A [Streptococcus mitis]
MKLKHVLTGTVMGLSLVMAGVWNSVGAKNLSYHFERATVRPDDGNDINFSGYTTLVDIDTKEEIKYLGRGRGPAETIEGYTYVNSVKIDSPLGDNLFHQYKKNESSPMYALPGVGVKTSSIPKYTSPAKEPIGPENESKKNYVIPDPGFTSGDPLNRNSKKSEETPKAKKVGWVLENGKWFYFDQSGRKQVGWLQVGGVWYYLANDGQMQLGWLYIGNAWYYLNGSGAMVTGWFQTGGVWYYLNGSGVMVTGWLHQGNTWYYLNGSGAMNKGGWSQVGKSWYYFTNSGALLVNTTTPDGYRVNANGEWV